MEEIWKPIVGFEHYSVSNLGQIRNDTTEIIMKGSKTPSGFLSVSLYDDNKKKSNHFIHRLVSTNFIEKPDYKTFIDHINKDKTDNRVENLRWLSKVERSVYNHEGVYFNKTSKKWVVKLKHIDGDIHVGTFNSEEEAYQQQHIAAYKHFKMFSEYFEPKNVS